MQRAYPAHVASCKNATGALAGPRTAATTSGVLRPGQTAATADLQREHPLSAELLPFVERYWSVQWDLRGRPAYRSEVLSHPSVNLSVESGDTRRFGHDLPAVLVHGVVARRFVVDLSGWGRVTAAKFRPGGFPAFSGHRPAQGSVALLRRQLPLDAAALLRSVLAEQDDAARAAVLDAFLCRLAPTPDPTHLDLLEVVTRMQEDRSLVRVEQVAALAGTSVRSLQRLFADRVGIGPKAVLARYRLQDAVAAIDGGAVDDLAGLAAALGWSDQAHFSRDFRAVVGTTPSRYLQQARTAASGR